MKYVASIRAVKYVLSLVAVIVMVAFSTHVMAMDESKAVVGVPAPEFTLPDTDGVNHSLSDYKGKTIVLEWTNHQCPYVRKHYDTKNMQTLQKEAADNGVVWLTINSSAPGMQGYTNAEEAKILIQKEGSHEAARLLDPEGSVGRLYGARTTPHMYIIDEDGVLVYAGAIDNNPSSRHDAIETADNYVREALNALNAGEEIVRNQTQPYGCSVKYKM